METLLTPFFGQTHSRPPLDGKGASSAPGSRLETQLHVTIGNKIVFPGRLLGATSTTSRMDTDGPPPGGGSAAGPDARERSIRPELVEL